MNEYYDDHAESTYKSKYRGIPNGINAVKFTISLSSALLFTELIDYNALLFTSQIKARICSA